METPVSPSYNYNIGQSPSMTPPRVYYNSPSIQAYTQSPASSAVPKSTGVVGNQLYTRLKKWIATVKANRSVPVEGIAQINPMQTPFYAALTVETLNSLTLETPKRPGSAFSLQLNGTFFHMGSGRFFGRTAKLCSIDISVTNNAPTGRAAREPVVKQIYTAPNIKKSFYFNSKVSDKEKVQLVIEFVVHEIDLRTRVSLESYGVGWTFLSPYTTGQGKLADVFQGTPRLLSAFANQPKLVKTTASLKYSVMSYPALGGVANYMPHMMLFSSDDRIPGVLDNCLPEDPSKVSKIETVPSYVVYAENIKVKLPKGLLKEVSEAMNEHQKTLQTQPNSMASSPMAGGTELRNSGLSMATFKELRLVCFFHNGFTAINKKQYGNYVILLDEDGQFTEFKFIGNIGIDNVFDHESTYFVVQLEAVYTIGLMHNQTREEKVALGWAPLLLPKIQNASRSLFPLDLMLIAGPGISISGDRLFESTLPKEEHDISRGSASRLMEDNKMRLHLTLNLEQLVLNPSARISNQNMGYPNQPMDNNSMLMASGNLRVPGPASMMNSQGSFYNQPSPMSSHTGLPVAHPDYLKDSSYQMQNPAFSAYENQVMEGTYAQALPRPDGQLEDYENKPPPGPDDFPPSNPPENAGFMSPPPGQSPVPSLHQLATDGKAYNDHVMGSHPQPSVIPFNTGGGYSPENSYGGPMVIQQSIAANERLQKEIEELKAGQQKLLDIVYNIHQTNEWNKYIGTTEYNDSKVSRLEKLKAASMAESKLKEQRNSEVQGAASAEGQMSFAQKELQMAEREIPRAERMNLYEKAFKGLLDEQLDAISLFGTTELEISDKEMQMFLEDVRKASEFQIQFMVMKFGCSLTSAHVPPPEKVVFSFTFFDQAPFQTEPLSFEEAKSSECKAFGGWHKFALASEEPMILNRDMYLNHKEEPKYAIYRFEVDPSDVSAETNDPIPGRYTRLINYLHSKSLIIDVYDATTMMFYGLIRVPLRGLLRRSQESVMLSKEYSILNPVSNEMRGSIQLMIRHTGKHSLSPCGSYANEVIHNPHEDSGAAKSSNSRHSKSFVPMSYDPKLATMQSQAVAIQASTSSQNPFYKSAQMASQRPPGSATGFGVGEKSAREKKLEKIGKYKHLQMMQTAPAQHQNPLQSTWGHSSYSTRGGMSQKEINRELMAQKEIKKAQIIMTPGGGFTPSFSSNIISLSSVEGECMILPYTVHNHLEKEIAVSVLVREVGFYDPEKKTSLSLISDPAEWRHWVNQKRIRAPPEFEMVTKENGFIMKPDERVTLLFKYQRFLGISGEPKRNSGNSIVKKSETKVSSASPPSKRKLEFSSVQSYEISIMDANSIFMEGFTVRAYLMPPTCDHKFKYFLPENKREEIILPALTTKNHDVNEEGSRPLFRCSHDSVAIRWDENQKKVVACLKVPSAPIKQEISVFAYKDSFLSQLLGHWLIEVTAMRSHSDEYKIGFRQKLTLTLDGGPEPRGARLFTDHPRICMFPMEYRGKFPLMPGVQNKINLIIRPTEVGDCKVRVNLVDDRTRELIGAWIVGVKAELPLVSKISKFDVVPNESPAFIIEYQSPLSTKSIFSFESSNTNLIRVIDTSMIFEAGEKKEIHVSIVPLQERNKYTCFLFITDDSDQVNETFQLLVNCQI